MTDSQKLNQILASISEIKQALRVTTPNAKEAPAKKMSKLLTISELSGQIAISKSTLYKWVSTSRLPHRNFRTMPYASSKANTSLAEVKKSIGNLR